VDLVFCSDKTSTPSTTVQEEQPAETIVAMGSKLKVREVISIPHDSALAFYLSLNVEAVELPNRFGRDKTFPPLILDGASGVGKTQQAFALLRSGKTLIYLNLSEGRTSQLYQDMVSCAIIATNTSVINNAMESVEGIAEVGEDVFSRESLERVYRQISRNERLRDFELFIKSLLENQLIWREDELMKIQTSHSSNHKFSEDVVLFIDEALPGTDSTSTDRGNACKRMRFLRNLGRTMDMRVVLAGTAVTAANMIPETHASMSSSRVDGMEHGWMQVIFWWQLINDTTFKSILSDDLLSRFDCKNPSLLREAIRKERPLLAVLIQKVLRVR